MTKLHLRCLMGLAALLCAAPYLAAAEWGPAGGRLMTRWGRQVTPAAAWREYPRPQLVRDRWVNLNGLWDYAIEGEAGEWKGGQVENDKDDRLLRWNGAFPTRWEGRILVPFAIESALSGVGKEVRPGQLLWYRKTFETRREWGGSRVLLHFGAVDWHAIVFVNRKRLVENRGGYVPFSADITGALRPSGPQEILVAVWDPSNAGDQSVGKQSLPEMRQGYRYTPTTGIWQTVWMEPVPGEHIEGLHIVPDIDRGEVRVTVEARGGGVARVAVIDGARETAVSSGKAGAAIAVRIPAPKRWSPDQPFLYTLKVALGADRVSSYFGMRKIAIQPDERGVMRYFLNNRPLRFQFGPLDQGYWPDGVLTPPSDEAAAFDVKYLRDIGCNMARVHVKVHPERWYYHCDRLGLLVWQDFVCTRKFEPAITPASARQWESEQRRMVAALRNHPSIIQWIVFNEGWGQYDTGRLTGWAKSLDPTRLVTCASGWTDFAGVGEVRDIHDYSFYPSVPPAAMEKRRAVVLGEFGGFDVGLPGHMWHPDQVVKPTSGAAEDGGRQKYRDGEQWLEDYARWLSGWRRLIGRYGLNAGVYTQIADVEHEPNGWLTYDREVSKIAAADLRRLHSALYSPQAEPAATGGAGPWRWSPAPAGQWFQPAFDDAKWKESVGPVSLDAKEASLRRRLTLERVPRAPGIVARQTPGEADLYLNGKSVLTFNNRGVRDGAGVTVIPLRPQAAALLVRGMNHIAVRARFQSTPAEFDLELVDLQPD
jgi:hypothetical protein